MDFTIKDDCLGVELYECGFDLNKTQTRSLYKFLKEHFEKKKK